MARSKRAFALGAEELLEKVRRRSAQAAAAARVGGGKRSKPFSCCAFHLDEHDYFALSRRQC